MSMDLGKGDTKMPITERSPPAAPEAPEETPHGAGAGSRSNPNVQDTEDGASLHYATIVPKAANAGKSHQPRRTEEIEYAPLKGARSPLPRSATARTEEPELFYASLRLSPSQCN
ncbi:uncharacterized protein LOC116408735 [Xenopus tropicalis]|uniref:Uncharacterized protein LOC116408735 n=1 Tax=Xenopus tropicalis TaxID=8364 RepID=A0A8J1J6J7_XENTR|nr:uncharacterized protein LOC116408735 [Xenopus tropicalis]